MNKEARVLLAEILDGVMNELEKLTSSQPDLVSVTVWTLRDKVEKLKAILEHSGGSL